MNLFTIYFLLNLVSPSYGFSDEWICDGSKEKGTPLFNESERDYLSKNQKKKIAWLVKKHSVTEMKGCRKNTSHSFQSAVNPEIFVPNSYVNEQWALKNRGADLKRALTDILVHEVKGVAGEDIGLSGLPLENITSRVRVAVVDSGVDVTHPELKDAVIRKESECKAYAQYQDCLNHDSKPETCFDRYGKVDTDQNGYPLDCQGWNTISEKSDVEDEFGHGTHIAGIIAAKRDGLGVDGVLSQVEILPVKIGSTTDNGSAETQIDQIAKGVLYAVRSGAQVINLSLGWNFSQDSELMREMVSLAESKGVIVVAAAGNRGQDGASVPCLYSGVVCVAAHSVDGKITAFSNFGAGVDIAAPGEQILSTWPLNLRAKTFTERPGFELMSGTSMAAPFVTAAFARLLNLGFTREEALRRLMLGRRVDSQASVGKLDLKKAVEVKDTSLIRSVLKSPTLFSWKGSASPFSIELKHWGSQSLKEASLILILKSKKSQEKVTLKKNHFFLKEWKPGESLHLETALFSESLTVESSLELELKIEATSTTGVSFQQTLPLYLEAFQSVQSSAVQEGFPGLVKYMPRQKSPFDGFLKDAFFQPFQREDKKAQRDFLAFKKSGDTFFFSVFAETTESRSSVYSLRTAPVSVTLKDATLFNSKRVLDSAGNSSYLVSFIERNSKGGIKVYFYRDGKEWLKLDRIDVGFSPRFSVAQMGEELSVVWLARGSPALSLLKDENPWNDKEIPEFKNRLYVLNAKGLSEVFLPKVNSADRVDLVSTLPVSDVEKSEGLFRVLVGKGTGFFKSYSSYVLREGILQFESELRFQSFHRFDDLDAIPLLGSNPRRFGFLFSDESVEGSIKVSVSDFSSNEQVQVQPFLPEVFLSPAIAAFQNQNGFSFFYASRFDLGFFDGESKTSLRSLSRLPDASMKPFTLPQQALYLPASRSIGISSEVVVPVRSVDNGSKNLIRPGWGRFLAVDSCEEMNSVDVNSNEPALIHFLCADSVVSLEIPDFRN